MRYSDRVKQAQPQTPPKKILFSKTPSFSSFTFKHNLLRFSLLSRNLFITLKAQISNCHTVRSPVAYNNSHWECIVDTLPPGYHRILPYCHQPSHIHQRWGRSITLPPSSCHHHFALLSLHIAFSCLIKPDIAAPTSGHSCFVTSLLD